MPFVYTDYNGLELAELVKRREISVIEIIEAAIVQIEKFNPKLNAVIYRMYQQARTIAREIPLEQGVFFGVPILLKDLLSTVQGIPTSQGSQFFRTHSAKIDTMLVKRFKKAGLIILGKTNTPEFGLSISTEPAAFGPTCNPWDLNLSAGGSSGGAAAAVASRMVPWAHGGDAGGSLRTPAAWCGVFGLKPTAGRVPTGLTGTVLMGLAVEHVITRSVQDSAAMLDAIGDPLLGEMNPPCFLKKLQTAPLPLKLGVVQTDFFKAKECVESQVAVRKAVQLFENAGHEIIPAFISLDHEKILKAYLVILAAETNYLIHFLSQEMNKKISRRDLEASTQFIQHLGVHFTAADYAWAIHYFEEVKQQVAPLFNQFDVLLTPGVISPPPRLGEIPLHGVDKVILEILSYFPARPIVKKVLNRVASQIFSSIPYFPLFNITGHPAAVIPIYRKDNIPFAVQCVARLGREDFLFQLARYVEVERPWSGFYSEIQQ